MMFEGPWGVAIQKNLNQNLKYDTAPLPKGMTSGTVVRGVAQYGDHPGPEQGGGLEVRALDLGPGGQRDVGQGDAAISRLGRTWRRSRSSRRTSSLQAFVQQMQQPNAKSPFLGMPNAVQMNKIMTTEVQNVVQGKKNAKQALDDAAAEWNKILAK